MSESIPYNNEKIIDWSKSNLQAVKATIDNMGIKHARFSPSPRSLKNALTVKTRQRAGLVDKISYKMPRSGVMRHKGVGKGRGIRSGRTIPAPWFDTPTNQNLPKLLDIVADSDCTYVINNISIK